MLMQRAAELGHAQAQHRLATAYATGVLHGGDGGLVPMDAGKALLLDYRYFYTSKCKASVPQAPENSADPTSN